MKPITVGAVLYDPKVSIIWDIIREFFETNGCPMDVKLYKDYDLQNAALMAGEIDIAWNSPLAWVDVQRRSSGTCRAIAMRDTDRDRVSHLIAAKEIGGVEELRGKVVAFGAEDSPQARLIPQGLLLRLRFAETDPLQTSVFQDKIRSELGFDFSFGFQYRPLLTDNIIITAGLGVLIPGSGFRDIYRNSTDPVANFDDTYPSRIGKPDAYLYSGVIAINFTY